MSILDWFRRPPPAPSPAALPPAQTRADAWAPGLFDDYAHPGSGPSLGTKAGRAGAATLGGHPPMPYSTIDGLLGSNAIARRIVFREPADALRLGVRITGLEGDSATALYDAMDAGDMWGALIRASAFARAYGGGIAIADLDDGRGAHEPVDWSRLARVRGWRVADRHDVQQVHATRDGMRDRIDGYRVTLRSPDGASREVDIHASRCVVFRGQPMPARFTGNGDHAAYWGGSVLDIIALDLARYGLSQQLISDAQMIATQGVLASRFVGDLLSAGNQGAAIQRAAALARSMSILNDIVIDKDNESYSIESRGAPGMAELHDRIVSALVSATGMPRLVLLGETPSGLSSGAMAGELRAWYDEVSARQATSYIRPVRQALLFYLRSSEGPTLGQVPHPMTIEWPPLWSETAAEAADLRAKRATARKTDVDAGIISADEARHDIDLAEVYGIDPDDPAPERAMTTEAMGGDIDAGIVAPVQDDEPLVGLSSVAERMGCSSSMLIARIRRGELPAMRIGSRYRVKPSDAMRLLQPVEAAPPAPEDSGDAQ